MPREAPDFEQIARWVMNAEWVVDIGAGQVGTIIDDAWHERRVQAVAEQLRRVWNARGAADIAKVNAEWREGLAAAAIDRALRSLDR